MWFEQEHQPKPKITISSQDGMNMRQEMLIHQKKGHHHPQKTSQEPHPLYPVEKPHPNLKPMPPLPPDTAFSSPQQPKRTSIIVEKESEEGALTLRGCCIVISIIEMMLGLVNLTELTVDLDNWINRREFYVQNLQNGTLLSSVNLLSFTKSDFSFSRFTPDPNNKRYYIPYKLWGCVSMEILRLLSSLCLLIGVMFGEIGYLCWIWMIISPLRIMAMFILLPDTVFIIIMEIFFIWIVITFRKVSFGPLDEDKPHPTLGVMQTIP